MSSVEASSSSSIGASPRSRVLGVDVARTAALVLMVIAHVAPSDGPLRILLVSEFLTAPTFALLVGVGAQLGERRAARVLVRAALIFGIGLLLALSQAQVEIVLMHLAFVMALDIPLVRRRTGVLAALGAAILVLALLLPVAGQALVGRGAMADSAVLQVVGLLGGVGPYRLAGMVAASVVGMLLVRWMRHPALGTRPGIAVLCGSLALLAFASLVILPNLLGIVEVHAYDGTAPEVIGDIAGAAGILLLCWGGAQLLGRVLPEDPVRGVLGILAAAGGMSLTLYCAQVLVLHLVAVHSPGQRDDSWILLLAMILAGGVFAVAWSGATAALRRRGHRIPAAWRRGPVEGIIELVVSRCDLRPSRAGASGRE